METLLFLLTGIVIGAIIIWLFLNNKNKGISPTELTEKYVSKETFEQLKQIYDTTQQQLKLKDEKISKDYIQKELYDNLSKILLEKEQELTTLKETIGKQTEKIKSLEQYIEEKKKEIEDIGKKLQTEFENLANKLLEEKSKKFVEINQEKLDVIISPFKERIKEFEKKIEERYNDEMKDKASLRKEIQQITELNKKLSEDAERLTTALKGDKKYQGD